MIIKVLLPHGINIIINFKIKTENLLYLKIDILFNLRLINNRIKQQQKEDKKARKQKTFCYPKEMNKD